MDKMQPSVESVRELGLRQWLRQELLCWRSPARTVVAAVCYRLQANGEIEFLLVRTRARRWTFPKGGVDGDPTAAVAAAREAHEEAGVLGRVEPRAFTRYQHHKNAGATHTVDAHLCRVLQLETPREAFRTPRWFSAEGAKRRLRDERPAFYADELERVVDQAVLRVTAGCSRTVVSHLN